MALVGDLIMSARELFTDLPSQVLAPPAGIVLAAVAPTTGSFPPATYFIIVTQLNQWGESLGSQESSIVIGAPSDLSVTINNANAAANFVRIYYAGASQTQQYYHQFPFVGGSGTFVFNQLNQLSASPPLRSTAYMPDTDGPSVGAFAIYRWLNQALAWAAAKNHGGLPDFGAVGTIGGQPNYVLPGYWKKIDSAWYDGYPLGLLTKGNVFRRNPVPGFSGMLIVFQATDRLMVEAWPQPNRTSAQTTLAVPMTVTDTTATITSSAAFVLGFGLVQIGTEIVNFSNIVMGNQLAGLQRGMAGTTPVSHLVAEPVTELNLMIAGYRVPSTYSLGQAATTLYLPPGWDEAIATYMLYRFRKAEQDEPGAKAALQEATQKMSDLSANRIIAGPRQVQPYGVSGVEIAAGRGSIFGGVIIP